MGVLRTKSAWGGGEWQPWVVWPFWIVVIVACAWAATVSIRTVARTVDETKCVHQQRYFPENEVKFVDWNYFDWSCLVTTDSGVSVEVEQFRATLEGD